MDDLDRLALRLPAQVTAALRFGSALIAIAASSVDAFAVQYDVVVYGGTSAAVTAAVEVARMGKTVVIVSPDDHLGGMTSNGLGWTDLGDRDTIGGLSREFYQRVYNYYLPASAWTTETRQNYINRSSLDPDASRQMMFTFEPKVAQQIFSSLVTEANVPVIAGQLDRTSGVSKTGQQITSIRTVSGTTISGKAFIDATYEGDLMAAAGVSYTVGREANSQYNETLNGIQAARATKNQLPTGIDPYVVPGNSASGLLPGVNANAGGADGTGDKRLQAYTYRMVLTNNAANRTPVPKPANYNEANYELLFRAIAAGQTNSFFKLDPMPNNKTDSNNASGMSTDFIGGNYSLSTNMNYAEADYATRDQLNQAQRDYQMGLVWALQNSPRVPQSIRNVWDDWGLPLDEFTNNGHWPNQIYVREGRRMVSDLVINEHHVNQDAGFAFSDSVGMGGYNMDSHNVQRYVSNGQVRNEGDIQMSPADGPYPISYRAMVPRAGEAENLLVPVALSASHIAYGSIRMEPVFMTLGQSAGAAAVLLGQRSVAAQDLTYPLLRSQMIRDQQMLGTGYVSSDPGILLNFGAVVSNDANSPGHAAGGIPGTHWNTIIGDQSSGITDSQGAATNISVNLGKSGAGQQVIDWEATGFSTISRGSQLNTGLYAGNVSSALFVNNGSSSSVDLGVRISGLTAGTYDTFVTSKNTNTASTEQYNVYSLLVDPTDGDTDYSTTAPTKLAHGSDNVWRHGEDFLDVSFETNGQKDLVLVIEGITPGELRGFLNTLEIVKIAAPISADVNHDGHVDLFDFTVIQQHYLAQVSLGMNGDANSDGLVNQKDFFLWRQTYLAQGGDATALNGLLVPEPAAVTNLLFVAPLLTRFFACKVARCAAAARPLQSASDEHRN